MLIISFSLELFNGPVFFFHAEKVNYIHYSHSNIVVLLEPPLHSPLPSCIHIHLHPHTHTFLCLAVMKYAHTVYSLINWGCRLRHKRLHKAIPCGYFSRFIFFLTWKWTAEFLQFFSLPGPPPTLRVTSWTSDSPASRCRNYYKQESRASSRGQGSWFSRSVCCAKRDAVQ